MIRITVDTEAEKRAIESAFTATTGLPRISQMARGRGMLGRFDYTIELAMPEAEAKGRHQRVAPGDGHREA